jgi:DNA-binding PadR family transcriptional regulator
MKKAKESIGRFEELVLLAIHKLGTDAYGVSINDALEEANSSVSIGALYTTLSRLEEKGLISSRIGEPTNERGGRAKKFFKLEAAGERALREADAARKTLTPKLGFTFGGAA